MGHGGKDVADVAETVIRKAEIIRILGVRCIPAMDWFEKTLCFIEAEQARCQTPSRFLRSKAAGKL